MNDNFAQQNEAKDEMLRSLQGTYDEDKCSLIDYRSSYNVEKQI